MGELRTIVAIEQDGMNTRTLAILVRVLDTSINLTDAVKRACTEYVKTKNGFDTYQYNCNLFNWADFETSVPNEICRKYGFEKVDSILSEEDVVWDEQLVDETSICLTDKEFEELKSALFMYGNEALEDFTDMDLSKYDDKDTIENILDEIAAQMPDEEQRQFYIKYVKNDDKPIESENSYDVSIAINGRIDIHVNNAEDVNDAKEKAITKFRNEANIGDIECIDVHAVNATDANGNLTDY